MRPDDARPRLPAPRLAARLAAALIALVPLLAACAGGSAGTAGVREIVDAVPFAAGEQLVYTLRDSSGAAVGSATLAVTAEGDALALRQEYRSAGSDAVSDVSTVAVDARTLRPRSTERTTQARPGDDRTRATYRATYAADGTSVSGDAVNADGTRHWRQQLRPGTYDNESALWLWRTVAFAPGFEARYISFNPVEHSRQTVTLRVIDRPTITVPAGSFETWRVQVRNGRATRIAWINAQAPHQVVQWDNGAVVFQLAPDGAAAR